MCTFNSLKTEIAPDNNKFIMCLTANTVLVQLVRAVCLCMHTNLYILYVSSEFLNASGGIHSYHSNLKC
jgi:hypothetical protein